MEEMKDNLNSLNMLTMQSKSKVDEMDTIQKQQIDYLDYHLKQKEMMEDMRYTQAKVHYKGLKKNYNESLEKVNG